MFESGEFISSKTSGRWSIRNVWKSLKLSNVREPLEVVEVLENNEPKSGWIIRCILKKTVALKQIGHVIGRLINHRSGGIAATVEMRRRIQTVPAPEFWQQPQRVATKTSYRNGRRSTFSRVANRLMRPLLREPLERLRFIRWQCVRCEINHPRSWTINHPLLELSLCVERMNLLQINDCSEFSGEPERFSVCVCATSSPPPRQFICWYGISPNSSNLNCVEAHISVRRNKGFVG